MRCFFMDYIYNDKEYINLVKDILKNDKFKKIDLCIHHGLSRLDHSLRVSYFSYKVAKKIKLDFVACARAGLLHDFFIQEDLSEFEQKISAFLHHKVALENSCTFFEISNKEKDIIYKHMFPLVISTIPIYLESYLVSIVDKIVAVYDFCLSTSFSLRKKYNTVNTSIFMFMIFCCYFNNL